MRSELDYSCTASSSWRPDKPRAPHFLGCKTSAPPHLPNLILHWHRILKVDKVRNKEHHFIEWSSCVTTLQVTASVCSIQASTASYLVCNLGQSINFLHPVSGVHLSLPYLDAIRPAVHPTTHLLATPPILSVRLHVLLALPKKHHLYIIRSILHIFIPRYASCDNGYYSMFGRKTTCYIVDLDKTGVLQSRWGLYYFPSRKVKQ